MITHLAGTVARIDIGDLTVELEVAGVRYQVLVPAVLWPEIQTIVDQAEGEDEAKLGLHIIYHATTNAPVPMLIGFIRRGERVFFRKLMSVEGLGPTKAAKALTISVSSMARAIEEENRGMLTKLPGIGGRAADKIIANPGTITGSIGVILRGNNISKLLERIGIKFETVKSGLFKDILSPDRALSEEERSLLQSLIDSSYDQFVKAVAEGRKLSEEKVRDFADGRVFTGVQAKELGLVDEVGDENDARILATKLADLDEKLEPITLGRPKKKLIGLLPGGKTLSNLLEMLNLEICTNGQPLWLFRP